VCEPEPGERQRRPAPEPQPTREMPARQPQRVPVQESIIARRTITQTHTSGANALAAAPAPHPAEAIPDKLHRPAAKMLAAALCTAIDAATAAEEYAAQKGAHFSFSADDVRAMG